MRQPSRVGYVVLVVSFALLASTTEAMAASGDLDTTFSVDGTTVTPVRDSSGAHDVAVQADGKIVVAGYAWSPREIHFALVRYTAQGSRDLTFGNRGRVVTDMGRGGAARAVAILPSGRILAAGYAAVKNHARFALARYDATGALDQNFGGDGRVTTLFGSEAQGLGMAVQSDGKIVVVGSSDSRFAVARYTHDGVLDPTFGGDGTVRTSIGSYASASDVVITGGGEIVVAGDAQVNGGSRFAVVRYRANGSLDRRFGGDGIVTTQFGVDDGGRGVILQPDGKIVVAGFTAGRHRGYRFALARYRAGGSLDLSFGGDGKVITSFGDTDATAFDATLQGGKIVVVGRTGEIGGTWGFALGRYQADGRLDPTFGGDGRVATAIGVSGAIAEGVAIQPGGEIVAVGETVRRRSRFVAARYIG
jgi:uncharacterized delta-60 repeat protein